MISLVSSRSGLRRQRRREILRERMAVRNLSVLLVDESADDRRKLLDLFYAIPELELSIRECASGLAALEFLRSQRIDVMLVDRLLPDMSGVDLISEAAEMLHDTAVILMSRSSQGSEAAAAMKSGARDYLLKRDLTAAALEAAVQEAVRSARLEWQSQRQTRRLHQTGERVGRLVGGLAPQLEASCDRAEKTLREMQQTQLEHGASSPLKGLAAHFAHVENSLRESRQFLAELTRLCDKAGWRKE